MLFTNQVMPCKSLQHNSDVKYYLRDPSKKSVFFMCICTLRPLFQKGDNVFHLGSHLFFVVVLSSKQKLVTSCVLDLVQENI